MAKKSKEELLQEMPSNYLPKEPMPYMAVFLDNDEAIRGMSDAQAGKLLKYLFDYAECYIDEYNEHAVPGLPKGMSPIVGGIAKSMARSIKRKADDYRLTSYGRSTGGRPKKDEKT